MWKCRNANCPLNRALSFTANVFVSLDLAHLLIYLCYAVERQQKKTKTKAFFLGLGKNGVLQLNNSPSLDAGLPRKSVAP